jgi:hypothetical protein
MGFSLKNRDTSGELIAFVKLKSNSYFCVAPVEYWIGEWWEGYIDLSSGVLEKLYFDFLHRFKVDINDLKQGYKELIETKDQFELAGNKPKLFIDLGEKYLASFFMEQELEDKVPQGWKGEHRNVEDLIPKEQRYWLG